MRRAQTFTSRSLLSGHIRGGWCRTLLLIPFARESDVSCEGPDLWVGQIVRCGVRSESEVSPAESQFQPEGTELRLANRVAETAARGRKWHVFSLPLTRITALRYSPESARLPS